MMCELVSVSVAALAGFVIDGDGVVVFSAG